MPGLTQQKRFALDWIDERARRFSDWHLRIWDYAEPAWREYKSAKAYCELLRSEGFAVEEGSGGMPTAFAASWGKGGPVLGSYAEYDAVPGNSQQVVPYQAPRAGLHPWAAGHTDPHSALGTTGSKPVHAAKGYFDGADAFISYHPHSGNTAIWDTQCGSYWSAVFTFETLAPETWIDKSLMPTRHNSHTAARCPGAIDALCLMYTMTKYTKEAMFPHTGTWTLNEFVMAAGDATSDNLPPRFSQIQYSWRSPMLGIQQQIYNVLANNARHAAGTTGCRASVRWVTKTRVGLTNHAMADMTFENMTLVGAPKFSEEAREFARKIQANLGLEPMPNPFLEDAERLMPPQEYETSLRRALPEWQQHYTSDDYVDYTWHAPTVRLLTMRPRLRPPNAAYEYPAWVHNALGGLPAAINPGIFLGAKTIAASLIDLLTAPEVLQRAQSEFKERTGGGIGGSKWVAPLLPKDFQAPVDLRWPEYIETVRGSEWWIPTPASGSGAGEAL
jgi:aminobenzoyl-glutamate utilization protein B